MMNGVAIVAFVRLIALIHPIYSLPVPFIRSPVISMSHCYSVGPAGINSRLLTRCQPPPLKQY